MRISAATDLLVKKFNGVTPTDIESGTVNCISVKKHDRMAVTNRPALLCLDQSGAANSGRGVYYWEKNSTIYFIRGRYVYRFVSGAPTVVATMNYITTSVERCYFVECGGLLVVLNTENNEAWTITTSHVSTLITDADFPATTCHGMAELNDVTYWMDHDGVIYGSDPGDPTSINPLNYLEAERSSDPGRILIGTSSNILAIGSDSLEVFFDSGQSVGGSSRLQRHEGIFYQQGTDQPQSFAVNGDVVFFVGQSGTGGYGVFMLDNLAMSKISSETIDNYLSSALTYSSPGFIVVGSSATVSGRVYYIMNLIYDAGAAYMDGVTLAYDVTSGKWSIWKTALGLNSAFSVISYFNQTYSLYAGYGMTNNGDIVSLSHTSIQSTQQDQMLDAGSAYPDQSIVCESYTGQFDGGTGRKKFPNSMRLVSEETSASNSVAVEYSNENNLAFGNAKSFDLGALTSVRRVGSFKRRNHHIAWSTDADPIYIEGIEYEF